MRRFLDRLYAFSGALAALSLLGISITMLVQAIGRELGWLFAGAEEITAWLCAASAFMALAHTFREGELVRVGLMLERLPHAWRRFAELGALSVAALVTGYIGHAVASFVYESWKLNELSEGLLSIPIWIPQLSLVLGTILLLIAVLDDFAAVLRGREASYQHAAAERRGRDIARVES